jgi:hypothetical protein
MDPDPGGPKTYGSYGSGSATLVSTFIASNSSLCKNAGNIRAASYCHDKHENNTVGRLNAHASSIRDKKGASLFEVKSTELVGFVKSSQSYVETKVLATSKEC